MSAETLVPYPELVAEVQRLCAEGRTGTLYIATARNEAGQIGLREGTIVSVRFHLRTGLDAVRGLREVKAARFSFMADVVEAPDLRQAVSSTAILALLTNTESNSHAEASAGMQRILTGTLTEYLGPMAAIVVRDQLRDAERAGRSTAEIVEALARSIDEPTGAAAFRQQALDALAARAGRRR
jgi:hypothetical protein